MPVYGRSSILSYSESLRLHTPEGWHRITYITVPRGLHIKVATGLLVRPTWLERLALRQPLNLRPNGVVYRHVTLHVMDCQAFVPGDVEVISHFKLVWNS